MKTLTEVMAEFLAEDQAEIRAMTEVLILETGLQLVREELGGKLSLHLEFPESDRHFQI